MTILLALLLCADPPRPPNVLIAISDDQSWRHTGVTGCAAVATPAFDRVAREGMLFTRAYVASPGCSPSRAALLTGRWPWQLKQAGTHASSFPEEYVTLPDRLEQVGYHVGHTGKGWGPGNFKASGRTRNPAGPAYQSRKLAPPPGLAVSRTDYAGNFADFLAGREPDRPFCFWYGGHEPHRDFREGSWREAGKELAAVDVPGFLPDNDTVRGDLLDYLVEIEHFDRHLARMLARLEQAGELDDTVVIVTSDNGMAFPRAKANCYEHGLRVPLAIRWPNGLRGGRECHRLVSLVDLAPTLLDVVGIGTAKDGPESVSGRSLRPLFGRPEAEWRDAVLAGRERHSSSRPDNLTYPIRCMRLGELLYVRNFAPHRWPAGDFRADEGYFDIDSSPTKTWLLEHPDSPFFAAATAKRPAEELYDLAADPACMADLAGRPEYAGRLTDLRRRLELELHATGDPRVTGAGDVYETYRRYSPIRKFPGEGVPED